MENKKVEVSKKDLLQNAKYDIERMLGSLMPIKFVKSELYVINEKLYAKLLQIDAVLAPNRKGTVKTNKYGIHTFVNILNPDSIAVLYTLTPVFKRKQISDFEKVKEQLAREHTLSAKILKNDFDDYVKNNDLSELAYQEKLQEHHDRLKLEQEYFDSIKNNPDDFKDDKLKIATHPVLHGQIRYYFINKDGVKEDVQKHLSSELPNILIFDENSGSKKRKDNKIDIFLNNSIRIFGNVYMKKD
jgi:hypothetical protein